MITMSLAVGLFRLTGYGQRLSLELGAIYMAPSFLRATISPNLRSYF